MVKTYSAYDYLQTRARLMHAVADHGLVLFGEFDHARAAQNVNLKMPPTTVLVFGNPKGGTPHAGASRTGAGFTVSGAH